MEAGLTPGGGVYTALLLMGTQSPPVGLPTFSSLSTALSGHLLGCWHGGHAVLPSRAVTATPGHVRDCGAGMPGLQGGGAQSGGVQAGGTAGDGGAAGVGQARPGWDRVRSHSGDQRCVLVCREAEEHRGGQEVGWRCRKAPLAGGRALGQSTPEQTSGVLWLTRGVQIQ